MFIPKNFTRLALLGFVFAATLFASHRSYAHPMGNFSINHYAKIEISHQTVQIRYLIDMAEIPTYQEIQQTAIIPKEGDPSLADYLARESQILKQGLLLEINGQRLPLQAISQQVIFPPGAGGLPTMKMGFVYHADLPRQLSSARLNLHYEDSNFPSHAGWKEVIINNQGVSLVSSSVPGKDRSSELTNYPTDLLSSPPQDLEATIIFIPPSSQPTAETAPNTSYPAANEVSARNDSATSDMRTKTALSNSLMEKKTPARATHRARTLSTKTQIHAAVDAVQNRRESAALSSTMPLQANKQRTPRNAFTELVAAKNLGFWFLLTAAFIAAGLGGLHALEPGHGKTLVAAYLVGSRGTAKHAVLLGLIVTAVHTSGVYLLAAITLYASRYIVPEQLYPWLGVISGLIIAGIGFLMFLRRWTGETGDHTHSPGQAHSHWFSSFGKPINRAKEKFSAREYSISGNQTEESSESLNNPKVKKGEVSFKQLAALGITGGIVPCPAALVVLLSAFSLHRIGFGLFLIVSFSFGLAAVLIATGLLIVFARRFMSRLKGEGSLIKRWLPLMSSGFMVILGTAIAVRALITTGIIGSHFDLQGKLAPLLAVILLGLFLGMRHSTDPDHVVAVSTIVTRQRSIRHAALIGILWGLGHTLTIFLVGAAIIIFGVVIPPRLGLAMEFSVALMLILLGILNLTGVMSWITERFTPLATPQLSPQLAYQTATLGAPGAGNIAGLSASSSLEKSDSKPSDLISFQPSGTEQKDAGKLGTVELFLDRTVGRFGLYQLLRPLVVGIVHGLAGSAAVALLVLSTIHSPLWATAYLLIFGAGTMVGMMLMTVAMAVPIAYTGNRFLRMNRYLVIASGVASLAFGLFLVYQIGFIGRLFTASPQWTPH